MKDLVDSAGQVLPPVETPTDEKLRVYGDLMFLAFRSARHSLMSTATLRTYLEPPLELGQFRVFRFDGVPRGMYTWAWLGQSAEEKLISGEPLSGCDWQSGEALWIVDMIAPYRGVTKSMVRFVMTPGNFSDREFYFRKVGGVNDTRRIVHISFRRRKLSSVMSEDEFFRRRVG
ncbi:MAG: toxin-activating lysine-acyltransferase [Rhodobacter sp.]|nr:toxin-activating lysine-acyltransferase [Rhodobacter sp.]